MQFISASPIFVAYRPSRGTPGTAVSPRHIHAEQRRSRRIRSPFGAISIGSNTAFQAFFSGSTLAVQIGYIPPVLGRCPYEDTPDYKNEPPWTLGQDRQEGSGCLEFLHYTDS